MRTKRLLLFSAIAAVLAFSLPVTAYAVELLPENTETFSYSKFLPVIFGGTLIAEALLIMFLSNIKRIVNVSYAVFVANLISFASIRVGLGLFHQTIFYTGMLSRGFNWFNVFVNLCYLAVALIIEIPIVWLFLRAFTKERTRLMLSVAAANFLTTVAVAVLELMLKNWFIS